MPQPESNVKKVVFGVVHFFIFPAVDFFLREGTRSSGLSPAYAHDNDALHTSSVQIFSPEMNTSIPTEPLSSSVARKQEIGSWLVHHARRVDLGSRYGPMTINTAVG